MKNKRLKQEVKRIDELLSRVPVDSKSYQDLLATRQKLVQMDKGPTLSGDAILGAIVTTAGYLLVTHAEGFRAVTSKVFTMVPKMKI